jgi:hypothetical protein
MKALCPDLAHSSIAFNSCAFHSENFIAVRNYVETDKTSYLTVMSPTEKRTVISQQTFAESAIMHPHHCIAALKRESQCN